jgi:hypothetical protein
MAKAQVMALLEPPVKRVSEDIAKETINSQFRSTDDLGNLDGLVGEAKSKFEELSNAVRTPAQLYLTMFLNQTW